MLSCWEHDPCKRPNFSDAVISVEKMIAPLANYMDFIEYFSLKETDENKSNI